MTESKTDLAQFRADLQKYAEIAEVGFNGPAVDEALSAYREQFETGTITVRTTTESPSRRSVNFRYMTPELKHDPVAIAREKGLFVPTGRPVELLAQEVTEKLPVWWGVDISVGNGFEKAWAFLENPPTFEELVSLEHVPDSIRNHGERWARAGLDSFCIMAFDFRNGTTNVYSRMLAPGTVTQEAAEEMILEMKSPLPSDEELRRDTEAVNVYYTFDWVSPDAKRLCFAMTATEQTFPGHWHPLAARFKAEAPFKAEDRGLIFNTTYGASGGYLKVEADYTGDAGPRVFGYWDK
jgi:hypothetical protein